MAVAVEILSFRSCDATSYCYIILPGRAKKSQNLLGYRLHKFTCAVAWDHCWSPNSNAFSDKDIQDSFSTNSCKYMIDSVRF
jgi:hypothetical protein